MLPAPITVAPRHARGFMRRALRLDEFVPSISAALEHHGYIQIDPINISGRMHDLILRNRVAGYREGDLMRHLHGPETSPPGAKRIAFEHHLPESHVLVAFPLEAWPHLLTAMQGRTRRAGAWSGRLTPRERELAPHLIAELTARGPLGSEDLHDGRRSRRVWGSMTLAKSTLQKLFFHGRLLIAGRSHNRRLYHLPERVLPAGVLSLPAAAAAETARWLTLLKLRQRRLVTLKKTEIPLVADAIQPVAVENCPTLYCLRDDVPALLAAAETPTAAARASAASVKLLAPLDPLIYDRTVTRRLWDYDYTWEAYTPAHKRVRGYYALPVLSGTELVGHVDPKADRERRKLIVVSRRVRRGHPVAPALQQLALFLGLQGTAANVKRKR
ncbi:MAG: hypothetical protein JWM88_2263 [Verrucomicrobia bacterium]|nr:hypothetical protein [Verrucomicrobiota bacterium]